MVQVSHITVTQEITLQHTYNTSINLYLEGSFPFRKWVVLSVITYNTNHKVKFLSVLISQRTLSYHDFTDLDFTDLTGLITLITVFKFNFGSFLFL